MSDAIQTAIARSRGATTAAIATAQSTAATALAAIPPLPSTKDPELLKRRAEARAQKLISEQKEKVLQAKDKAVETAKTAVAGQASAVLGSLPGIPKFPKLPVFDPKLIAALGVAKKIKAMIKDRKKISKDNLEKCKEAFTYPIKPMKKIIPELPDLFPEFDIDIKPPTIPDLPLKL